MTYTNHAVIKSSCDTANLNNLTVDHSLQPSSIGEVHILDWRGDPGAVISCDDLVDITDLVKFSRNPSCDGLYVLVKQEIQLLSLYSLVKEPMGVSDIRAGVLKMKCEFVFDRKNTRSVGHLPEVLNNLEKYGNTVITITKDSRDGRTPDQLCAAAAFHHHQDRIAKQGHQGGEK